MWDLVLPWCLFANSASASPGLRCEGIALLIACAAILSDLVWSCVFCGEECSLYNLQTDRDSNRRATFGLWGGKGDEEVECQQDGGGS